MPPLPDAFAGQHSAIMAGFGVCRGQRIVTLDADLQNQAAEKQRDQQQNADRDEPPSRGKEADKWVEVQCTITADDLSG